MVFVDFVYDLAFEATQKYLNKKVDSHKLKKSITEYIKRQGKCIEMVPASEEFDYQGLYDYIKNHFLDSITSAMFDPNPTIRAQKKNDIIVNAISHSNAKTEEAQNSIKTIIENGIDILCHFYEEQIDIKDNIIGSKIVDAISQKVNHSTKQIISEIKDEIDFKSNNTSLISCDKVLELAENGKSQEIGADIKKALDHASHSHPLYPDYGYDYEKGILISKALTPDASKKYPSTLILTGSANLDNHLDNLADYSYRHQKPIIMNVLKAKQYLGKIQDPNQEYAKKLIGKTIVAKPHKISPEYPCSIKIKDKPYYEYILFRIQEIEDDGTFVISNREQDSAIKFEIRFNPNRTDLLAYTIQINNATNHELLDYTQFMHDLLKDGDLHIHLLSNNDDLISGYVNNKINDPEFKNLEEKLDILKRICAIEDYFDIEIPANVKIKSNDYNAIVQLSDLINNKEIINTWEEFTFTNIVDQQLRNWVAAIGESENSFSLVALCHVVILGAEISFDLMRTLKNVRIADLERLKEKLSIVDDGDSIRIILQPGASKTVIDTLHIPDNMKRK